MTHIDLTPLYRNSVGFDRFSTLLDNARRADNSSGYPPYNIRVLDENEYEITIAAAGFEESELDIQVENGVLSIRGKQASKDSDANYLHQGIATRSFERKFNLAEYVEVKNAALKNGLLSIALLREIPEAAKPKKIAINGSSTIESVKAA